MNVERIIVETNDETGNNPVEYDWEFGPDGVFRMTGDGGMPAGGDAKWLRPLAAMLAARIPFVSGSVESGLAVTITSPVFLDCCRSMWIGADVHHGMGRYLNFRWDRDRGEWVEAGTGLAFLGADSQVAFMLETGMNNGDGIRFDPMEGKEDTIQSFRLLLETATNADIPVSWGRDGRKNIIGVYITDGEDADTMATLDIGGQPWRAAINSRGYRPEARHGLALALRLPADRLDESTRKATE